MQLGEAHADILRLGAELSELERRNQELVQARTKQEQEDWVRSLDGMQQGQHVRRHQSKSDGKVVENNKSHEAAFGVASEGGSEGGKQTEKEKEQALLRQEFENEKEALLKMCNGLAVDLEAAVAARVEAEEDYKALLEVMR